MTTKSLPPPSHIHHFNHFTGRHRLHFDEAAAGAGAAAGAAGGAAVAWHDGVDAEVKGFWQNKGLPLDDAKAFGLKLTEMYKGAEKLIGVPQDQIVKLPKSDAPPEDLRAFYERLGAPKEAKDYDLSAVKDTSIAEAMRVSMHERGVPKDAAAAVATAVAKALDAKATSDNTAATLKLQEQKDALAKNWGDKFQYNHLQAIEGARKLGITPEAVKALEGVIGFDKVMEAMRNIGANVRESTLIGGGGPQQGEVSTVEGALARKAELMNDKAWVTKYNAGDPAAKREMTGLNQMITGVTA